MSTTQTEPSHAQGDDYLDTEDLEPKVRRMRDAEIFGAAVMALAGVLAGGRLLAAFAAEGFGAHGPSLAARFGSPTTVGNFTTFFVLLPVALAFVAIGIPFLLRSLAAAFRRTLEARELIGVVVVLSAVAGLFAEATFGTSGIASIGVMTAAGYALSWPAMAEARGRTAYGLLAAAGASLALLAYYERAFLAGAEPSLFIAPTFLVTGFFLGCTGVLCALPSALKTRRRGEPNGRAGFALCAAAVAAWLTSPLMRHWGADPGGADALEFYVTAGSALVLFAYGLNRAWRSAPPRFFSALADR